MSWCAKLNCNLLENIHSWMIVLYGQNLLHRLMATDRSTKTVKLFHLEQFAICDIAMLTNFLCNIIGLRS